MTVSETQYQDWSDDLAELDQQIEDLQKAKGDFYKTVRDEHGKKTADALKLAVKISRMDTEKRSAAEEVDAEAFRILSIISKPRAPRATHAPARHPKSTTPNASVPAGFDAETGEEVTSPEIIEPQVVPQPAQSEPLVTIHSDPLRSGAAIHEDAEPEAPTTPIQPETANEVPAQDSGGNETSSTDDSKPLGKSNAARPASVDAQPNGRGSAGEAGESVVTGGESAATNITPIRPIKQLRPLCQNRERCGASGPKECWKCLKATDQVGAA